MTLVAFVSTRMSVDAVRAGGSTLDDLISVSEAARRLGGISRATVYAWLSEGRLQRTKVGSRTMIRQSELAKVIEDGGKSPAPKRRVVHRA